MEGFCKDYVRILVRIPLRFHACQVLETNFRVWGVPGFGMGF